jgi:kinesin family protein 18/19
VDTENTSKNQPSSTTNITKLEIIQEEETNKYVEDLRKGTYNILVAIRCRPLFQKEREFLNKEIIKILDNKVVILLDPFEYNGHTEIFKNRSRESHYAFDYAFDQSSKQV